MRHHYPPCHLSRLARPITTNTIPITNSGSATTYDMSERKNIRTSAVPATTITTPMKKRARWFGCRAAVPAFFLRFTSIHRRPSVKTTASSAVETQTQMSILAFPHGSILQSDAAITARGSPVGHAPGVATRSSCSKILLESMMTGESCRRKYPGRQQRDTC